MAPCSLGEAIDMALETALPLNRLTPVGPMELVRSGWVSPYGRDSVAYVQVARGTGAGNPGSAGVVLGSETKILPAAVVNDLLAKKLKELEANGLLEGGQVRRRVREDLIAELLPKAFVMPARIGAYFDWKRGLFVVDTSSRGAADRVVSEVRASVGAFPCLPLNAERSPRAVLTGWVAGEDLPEGFSLGEQCDLAEPGTGGAKVNLRNFELAGEELEAMLAAGMQCTRLELNYGDRASFTIGEDLVIRSLKFMDGVLDGLNDGPPRDDLGAELDARFFLMQGEIGQLWDLLLEPAFKITATSIDAEQAASAVENISNTGAAERLDEMMRDQGITATLEAPGGEVLATFGGPALNKGEELIDRLCEVVSPGDKDPLIGEASKYVLESGKTSISGVQRVFKIGYNRAARLIEFMELNGLVSPPDAAGGRTVLAPKPKRTKA